MKSIWSMLISGILGGVVVLCFASQIQKNHNYQVHPVSTSESIEVPAISAPFDFKVAARKAMPAVVHIKASESDQSVQARKERERWRSSRSPFSLFFGDVFSQQRVRKQVGFGSGVIINEGGLIVTNNHVIDFADELEVTLHDNRTFKAKLIGTDPQSDLALIQMEGKGFDYLNFGDSDQVEVGEWVVAVGNPFDLTSTVTSGIVSAKGRSNILKAKDAVEDFIQTDAVVNPGNSGGALVDIQGNLIGINTAIASPDGVYAGYAFAIPGNLVLEIIEKIKIEAEKDKTDNGYIGLEFEEVDEELVEKYGLRTRSGLLVFKLDKNAPAFDAGFIAGDVIIEINNKSVRSRKEYEKILKNYFVGDVVTFTVARGGYVYEIPVRIKRSLER